MSFGFTACEPEREADVVAERSEALARSLRQTAAGSAPAMPGQGREDGPGDIRVYLDATESMRGFFTCDGAANDLELVLRRLGVDRVTLFGKPEPGSPPEAFFEERALDRWLRCGDGVRRKENPDYVLFQRIASDTTGAISLYLTDGVQSADNLVTPSPSIRALEEWIGQGRPLAILAFRGNFDGPAWSEERGGWLGDVTVPNRPFYAFVFAPSARRMDRFFDGLPGDLKDRAVTLRFEPDGVRCSSELVGPRYRSETEIPWIQLDLQSGARYFQGFADFARYTCTLSDAHPLQTVLARVTLAYGPWQNDGFPEALGDPPAGAEVAPDSVKPQRAGQVRSSTVYLRAHFPSAPGHRFGLYGVQLGGRPGSMRAEVDSLSTDSDDDPANFSRTYLFSWMVDRLVRAQFERDPQLRPVYVTLQYR